MTTTLQPFQWSETPVEEVDQAGKDRMRKALTNLALARQAEFEDGAQRVYLHLLADVDAVLVARACHSWALQPRAEYATAMPSVAELRATVEQIIREDAAATQRKALAAMPDQRSPDEPTYFCVDCLDEPSAFRPFWCCGSGDARVLDKPSHAPGSIVDCGRTKTHAPHPYVNRCQCSVYNPVIAGHRKRLREVQQRHETKRRRGDA